MRYHSLELDFPEPGTDLEPSAWINARGENILMAIQHRDLPVAGLQFHPESFLTQQGQAILENFLAWT